MSFAKYKTTRKGITQDGHVMFDHDIVAGLNRKSFLEGEKLLLEAENKTLKSMIETYEKLQERVK